MWIYHSRIGVLRIIWLPEKRLYAFLYDGEINVTYPSPVAVADDVYLQSTGCSALDDRDLDLPVDLSEWEFIPTASLPKPPCP